jgi:hypothetical protein
LTIVKIMFKNKRRKIITAIVPNPLPQAPERELANKEGAERRA